MPAPRTVVVLGFLAVASSQLAGCGEAPERREVDIHDLAYAPSSAIAKVGDTLVWTNHDLVPHTVTDVDGAWDSGPIVPGASWRLRLGEGRDTVAYTCTYHPTMTGSLVVR